MTAERLFCEQDSPEWHLMRQTKIGASEIAVILGVSEYQTARELAMVKLKMKPPQESNFAMDRGKALEPVAREKVSEKLNFSFLPAVFIDEKQPYLMCSLDGWDEKAKVVWEHKCPGKEEHEKTPNGPPEKYFWQIQCQLMITGAERCCYTTLWENEKTKEYDFQWCFVYPDEGAHRKIREVTQRFWGLLQKKILPPLSDKDWDERKDEDFLHWAACYNALADKADDIAAEMEELKEKMISMSTHSKSRGGGVKLQKISAKGNVDYKKIPQLKGVNLDMYRAKNKEYWKIDRDNKLESDE